MFGRTQTHGGHVFGLNAYKLKEMCGNRKLIFTQVLDIPDKQQGAARRNIYPVRKGLSNV